MVLASNFVELAVTALEGGKHLVHPKLSIYDSVLWNVVLWPAQTLRPVWMTGGCVAVWKSSFWAAGGYDPSCIPQMDQCREDLGMGRRISQRFGPDSVAVLPMLVATSARRWKRYGLNGLPNFADPVR